VIDLGADVNRLAWLGQQLGTLPGSGIIYTLTVAASQDVAHYLRELGYDVRAYSGQTDPAERLAAEQALLGNQVKALVATSALGMGFDKPDLGFVIHFGAPSSPISYYQHIGRAGRGVDRAQVILLPGREDQAIWDYFAATAFPPADQVRATLHVLAAQDGPMSTAALEAQVSLPRSRLESMLKVLDVGAAGRRPGSGGTTTRPAMPRSSRSAATSRPRCGSTSGPRRVACGSCANSSMTRIRATAAGATTAVA
jgi:ATP-dependent DNA helicase RecQ